MSFTTSTSSSHTHHTASQCAFEWNCLYDAHRTLFIEVDIEIILFIVVVVVFVLVSLSFLHSFVRFVLCRVLALVHSYSIFIRFVSFIKLSVHIAHRTLTMFALIDVWLFVCGEEQCDETRSLLTVSAIQCCLHWRRFVVLQPMSVSEA